jgi:hypothetical protein
VGLSVAKGKPKRSGGRIASCQEPSPKKRKVQQTFIKHLYNRHVCEWPHGNFGLITNRSGASKTITSTANEDNNKKVKET